ncbi:putative protein [Arabidopsis thaliana]|uniref:Uncharacterized protein AT4g23770 n=1 Tax=Arabidopsis thaliana TaxID=3702 RepID=Q9SUQ0_ARATH|nr:putative protein [Arabidopsis thaliana]CAB81295.1 putative protein [Arabidopsis thaliana]
MSSRLDQLVNKYNKSCENVSFAEHMILKDKYESLVIEHESLIKTLELLEKTHGFTVEDLVTKQKEALEKKEVIEKWENKFGEMEKKLKTVERSIEYIMSVDVQTGVDSGSANRPNVKNSYQRGIF